MSKIIKDYEDYLADEIERIQNNINSRGEIIRKLIKDGLEEIKIRDNLIKLKNENLNRTDNQRTTK